MNQKNPNHLINESSPYLLQHAYNPVAWFPWGEEALQKAKTENKPILVSIGYAACHWCHVMEKESFEDEQVAAFMNAHFVNIKIDREERPDLDHIYMDALQAMSGQGGWPLNVFLTPETKPFYGGTYFPPKSMYNRPSWMDVLYSIQQAFANKKEDILSQAENLTEHLITANKLGKKSGGATLEFSKEHANEMMVQLLGSADSVFGGFGQAPKFPQTFSLLFLLRHYHFTQNQAALNHALLSLNAMINGGIYDQLGGGFARYSTDKEWLAPHFEKMLYDNALLVSVMAEAFQLTHEKKYAQAIEETIAFIERELMHSQSGFYAALDADSEGEEGKFYVWQKEEIESLLGDFAPLFAAFYDVTDQGNWEEKNILRILKEKEVFCEEKELNVAAFEEQLEKAKHILFVERSKRVRPLLDDKIILGWNALMNTALSTAYAATGKKQYKERAIANMEFLLNSFEVDKRFMHTWKNGLAKHPAFLDDMAYLIQALMELQQITGHLKWLKEAQRLTEYTITHFSDEAQTLFYYTPDFQKDILLRKKEVYDGATPSGNAVMAQNLLLLSILLDKPEWRERADSMFESVGTAALRYPNSFGVWAGYFQLREQGVHEIVATGPVSDPESSLLLAHYIPNKVFIQSNETSDLPLLKGKSPTDIATYWLCKEYSCQQPTTDIQEFMKKI